MKTNRLFHLCTILAGFTLAAVVFASVAPVAEKKETAAQKKARETLEAALEKYDMNLNGKMDPDEQAMQQADVKKAAAEKRKATLAKKRADADAAKVAPAKVETPTAPAKSTTSKAKAAEK